MRSWTGPHVNVKCLIALGWPFTSSAAASVVEDDDHEGDMARSGNRGERSNPRGGRLPILPTGGRPHGTAPAGAEDATEIAQLAKALFKWARQDGRRQIIPAVERELVVQALLETQGNQVQAAKLLGITRATLRKRIAKFGIRQEFSAR